MICKGLELVHLLEEITIKIVNLALESTSLFSLSYDISSKNNGPKISMGTRGNGSALDAMNSTPGPGNYNTGGIFKPGTGVTLGAKY